MPFKSKKFIFPGIVTLILVTGLVLSRFSITKEQETRSAAAGDTPNIRLSFGTASTATLALPQTLAPNETKTYYIWAHNPAAATNPISMVDLQVYFNSSRIAAVTILPEVNSWTGKTPATLKPFTITNPDDQGGRIGKITLGTHCDTTACYPLKITPVKLAKITITAKDIPEALSTTVGITDSSYVAVTDQDTDWLMTGQNSHFLTLTINSPSQPEQPTQPPSSTPIKTPSPSPTPKPTSGSTPSPTNATWDLNGNGKVDIFDWSYFVKGFGGSFGMSHLQRFIQAFGD